MPAKKRPVSKARKPAKTKAGKLAIAGEKPAVKKKPVKKPVGKKKKAPSKAKELAIGGESPPTKKKSRIS